MAQSQNLTAVVTGAGSRRGIGRATAQALARNGWSIALVDIDAALAEEAAAWLVQDCGASALGVGCDLTDAEAVQAACRRIVHACPPVGALVNNAGVSSASPFLSTTLDEWDRVMAANTLSAFLITRELLPTMLERNGGRVVTVSSAAGQRGGGYFGGVHYSTSKAALLGFTRALAREFSGSGVTFNAVAPGAIDTDITAGRMTAERRRIIEDATPVQRLGTADEVAAVIAFLCSDEAAFVTGATYDVNGGSHIH